MSEEEKNHQICSTERKSQCWREELSQNHKLQSLQCTQGWHSRKCWHATDRVSCKRQCAWRGLPADQRSIFVQRTVNYTQLVSIFAERFEDTLKWTPQKSRGEGITVEILDAVLLTYRMMSHPALNARNPVETLMERKPKTIHNTLLPKEFNIPGLFSCFRKTRTTGTAVYVRDHQSNGTLGRR